MKKKIIFEATIKDDDTVEISITGTTPEPISLMEMLGCLEMIRQAAILSNKEFKTMYENIKWK